MPETKKISAKKEQKAPLSILQRHPKLVPALAVLLAAVLVGAAGVARYYGTLHGVNSSASCYGYACTPRVVLGGKVAAYGAGSSLSYGTLTVQAGQNIELSWNAANVDTCRANDSWTSFQGSFYPPTLYKRAMQKSQEFRVQCYIGRKVVVSANLDVQVQKAPVPSILTLLSMNSPSPQTYTDNRTNVHFIDFIVRSQSPKQEKLKTITLTVDSTIPLSQISNIGLADLSNRTNPIFTSKVVTYNKKPAIQLTFKTPQIIPTNKEIQYEVWGTPAQGYKGKVNFSVANLILDSNTKLNGLPVAGNYMTFQ